VKPEPPIDPSNPVNPPPDPSLQWFRGDYHTESDLKPLRYSSTNATGLLSTYPPCERHPTTSNRQSTIFSGQSTSRVTRKPLLMVPLSTSPAPQMNWYMRVYTSGSIVYPIHVLVCAPGAYQYRYQWHTSRVVCQDSTEAHDKGENRSTSSNC
jgi:hypothetical protein